VGPHLGDGTAWKVSTDTYEREVERYGGDDDVFGAGALLVWRSVPTVGTRFTGRSIDRTER
jgi:hypothetical protein